MKNWKKIVFFGVVIILFFGYLKILQRPLVKKDTKKEEIRLFQQEEKELLGNIWGYNPRVAEIQKLLKEKGYYTGKIDGYLGDLTRQAIKKFQEEINQKPSGYINNLTWFKLKETILVKKEKEEISTEILEHRLRNKERIRAIQMALKNAGFDPGPIDGKLGKKTKKALMAFQKKHGLYVDGIPGEKTWQALKKYLETVRKPEGGGS